MVKESTRKKVLSHLGSFSQEQIRRKSQAACENLCATEEFEQTSVMMIFLSLAKEVDTSYAIQTAIKLNKTVLVPCVDWDAQHLKPIVLETLDCEMVEDRYGLRHPAKGKIVPTEQIDIIVLPGVGFDSQGNRLGRGGGFYDRFLSNNGFRGSGVIRCGLAFEEQFIEQVPVFDHDVRLSMLVTDSLVRRFED